MTETPPQQPTADQLNSFYQNKLIQRLSTLPQWSVSDINKRPLNAKQGIKTHFRQVGLFSFKNNGIAPLTDFDRLVPPSLSNRALRLNMPVCRVIAVDIEPTYDHDRWNKWLTWMPVDYIEYSRHNGYHVLIDVSDRVYQHPKIHQMLKEHTKLVFFDEGKSHQGIEFTFNNAFITLTRRVITNPNDYPFEPLSIPNQTTKEDRLIAFLNYLQNLKQSEVNVQPVNVNKADYFNDEKQKKAKAIAKYLSKDDLQHAKDNALKIDSNTDGKLDLSRVEWRFMASVYGYYKQLPKNLNIVANLQQDLQIPSSSKVIKLLKDPKVAAATIAVIGHDHLEPREKWQSQRDGLPWLLYYGVKIVSYFNAKDRKEKKQHEN